MTFLSSALTCSPESAWAPAPEPNSVVRSAAIDKRYSFFASLSLQYTSFLFRVIL